MAETVKQFVQHPTPFLIASDVANPPADLPSYAVTGTETPVHAQVRFPTTYEITRDVINPLCMLWRRPKPILTR